MMDSYITAVDNEETDKALRRFRRLLAKITYKPGWVLEVVWTRYGAVELCATWPVTDVVTGASIKLEHKRRYGWRDLVRLTDAQVVEYFIYRFFYEAEVHELREWLKFDGDHVIDPHPATKKSAKV